MEVQINGEKYTLEKGITVMQLLAQLCLDPRIIIVEKNLVVVSKEQYKEEVIGENDCIELIRFMGGG